MRGAVGSVPMDMRRLTETGLNVKASFVVLAHNHPSGLLTPSKQDELVTMRVVEVLSRLNLILLDHLIMGRNDYISMAHCREYRYLFGLGRGRAL